MALCKLVLHCSLSDTSICWATESNANLSGLANSNVGVVVVLDCKAWLTLMSELLQYLSGLGNSNVGVVAVSVRIG